MEPCADLRQQLRLHVPVAEPHDLHAHRGLGVHACALVAPRATIEKPFASTATGEPTVPSGQVTVTCACSAAADAEVDPSQLAADVPAARW